MENENVPLIVKESLNEIASVRNVFGDAIETQGKTVVPVARIVMGIGGGFGKGFKEKASYKDEPTQGEAKGSGNGAGGGVYAVPLGVYEISGKRTKFIPARSSSALVLASVLGFLLGCWVTKKVSKQKAG